MQMKECIPHFASRSWSQSNVEVVSRERRKSRINDSSSAPFERAASALTLTKAQIRVGGKCGSLAMLDVPGTVPSETYL